MLSHHFQSALKYIINTAPTTEVTQRKWNLSVFGSACLFKCVSACIKIEIKDIVYCMCMYMYVYTGCPTRNGQNFGRVFLMLKYTDITQNTYIQSWTVTEIMAIEKCGLLGGSTFCTPSVTPYSSTAHARQRDIVMQWPWRMLYSTVALTSQDNCQLRPV